MFQSHFIFRDSGAEQSKVLMRRDPGLLPYKTLQPSTTHQNPWFSPTDSAEEPNFSGTDLPGSELAGFAENNLNTDKPSVPDLT
jgi:hypothetical protein